MKEKSSQKISKTTERVARLETAIYYTKDSIGRIEGKVDSLVRLEQKKNEEFRKRIDETCKDFDKRYAHKRVEKMVDNGLWLIIASFLIALLSLVLQNGAEDIFSALTPF